MDILFLYQFGCCLLTSFLAILLILSRLHINKKIETYERSRWVLTFSMIVFAIHYALQMTYGFRAQGDDIGGIINILFYTPISFMLAYSMNILTCGEQYCKRYIWVGSGFYSAILITFIIGYNIYHSLHMTYPMFIMDALFFGGIMYSIIFPLKEVQRMKKQIINNTASDLTTYEFFTKSGYSILCILSAFSTIFIFYRPLLNVFGPIFMTLIYFFVVSFINLGYTLTPVVGIIEQNNEEEVIPVADTESNGETKDDEGHIFSDEMQTLLRSRIDQWRKTRGYSKSDLSIATLSQHLDVKPSALSYYISKNYGCTFRVWLSKIRVEEAKRIMMQHPNYCNQAVADECGFTSRNYFQNLFKAETGLTPKEWVRSQTGVSSSESDE